MNRIMQVLHCHLFLSVSVFVNAPHVVYRHVTRLSGRVTRLAQALPKVMAANYYVHGRQRRGQAHADFGSGGSRDRLMLVLWASMT